MFEIFKPAPPATKLPEHRDLAMKEIDFHIQRFRLALGQCTKGPAREKELEDNLNYWLERKRLEELRS